MKQLLLAMALMLGTAGFASANELDNEPTNQSAMDGTVVIRVDNRTQETSILKTSEVMNGKDAAQALAKDGAFAKVPKSNVRTELDQDGGASSWYWYGGYNYYNYMYWYGSYYNPCYTYNYGYYSYYYYSNRGWWY
ncbi:hypothetical protein D3C72_1629330 [compost metagenome]